jgi:hypothetical protein
VLSRKPLFKSLLKIPHHLSMFAPIGLPPATRARAQGLQYLDS